MGSFRELPGAGGGGSDSGSGSTTDVSNPGINAAGVYAGRLSSFIVENRFRVLAANLTITINSDGAVTVGWRTPSGVFELRGRMVDATSFSTVYRFPRQYLADANESCSLTTVVNGRYQTDEIDAAAHVSFVCDSGSYRGSRGLRAQRSSLARQFSGSMSDQTRDPRSVIRRLRARDSLPRTQ